MLRTFILAVALCGVMALTASAADKGTKRTPLSEEQKKEKQALFDKYDKNKDGKLSKAEKDSMSAEDKAKLEKIQPARKKA
jgi:Ca2+-binding EF-hand superfamily protein